MLVVVLLVCPTLLSGCLPLARALELWLLPIVKLMCSCPYYHSFTFAPPTNHKQEPASFQPTYLPTTSVHPSALPLLPIMPAHLALNTCQYPSLLRASHRDVDIRSCNIVSNLVFDLEPGRAWSQQENGGGWDGWGMVSKVAPVFAHVSSNVYLVLLISWINSVSLFITNEDSNYRIQPSYVYTEVGWSTLAAGHSPGPSAVIDIWTLPVCNLEGQLLSTSNPNIMATSTWGHAVVGQ